MRALTTAALLGTSLLAAAASAQTTPPPGRTTGGGCTFSVGSPQRIPAREPRLRAISRSRRVA